MNGAIYESTFNFFFKLNYKKTYDVDPRDAARRRATSRSARSGWALIRGGALRDRVHGRDGAARAGRLAVGDPRRARRRCSSGSRSGRSAWPRRRSCGRGRTSTCIQLVVLPMFLFSATFYPIEAYPTRSADRRPADAAVPGRRPHPLADGRGDRPEPAGPRRVPVGDGHGRAGDRVAAARQARCSSGRRGDRPGRAARGADRARSSRAGAVRGWSSGASGSRVEKVARFRDETYWGRPLPGFGDPDARILLLGLAPAAHGGNRTGRVFTGDASGDFLWSALHAAGWPTGPSSRRADDGLTLHRRVHRGGRPLRPAGQQADDRRARRLRAVPGPRAGAARAGPGGRRARRSSAGTRRCGRSAELGHRRRGRGRRFGHGAEARVGPYTLARLVPPEPAEHVHRPPDAADARRGPRASPRAGVG